MALNEIFKVAQTEQVLRRSEFYINVPNQGFSTSGDLASVGEDQNDFDDLCIGNIIIEEAVADNEDLANAIVVMMNRAYAMGLQAGQKA